MSINALLSFCLLVVTWVGVPGNGTCLISEPTTTTATTSTTTTTSALRQCYMVTSVVTTYTRTSSTIQTISCSKNVTITSIVTKSTLDKMSIDDGSRNATYLVDELEVNPAELNDTDLLLETQEGVTCEHDCAIQCFKNALCCKAVLTQDSTCLLYAYIKDSELPFPEGATLLREECCYDGEREMGEVTLHLEAKRRGAAAAECAIRRGTLAKPKTLCAYNLLTNIAERKKGQLANPHRFWIALRNPSGKVFHYDDGSIPAFELPLEPNMSLGDREDVCTVEFKLSSWLICDVRDTNKRAESYMCQSNVL